MKKRILLVSSGKLDRSGVPSVIMTIVRALHEEFTFDIMLSSPQEGEFEKEFLNYGGRIIRYRKKKFGFSLLNTAADFFRPVSMFFTTRSVIRANGPYDAVHCHHEFDMAGSLAAAKRCKVPLRIAHEHKVWNRCRLASRLFRSLCRRTINRCATARVGCSQLANDAFYGKSVPTQVIYNPYDDRRFFCKTDETCRSDDLHMIQVGYFCENKNQLFSLEVLACIRRSLPSARLTLIGFDQDGYGNLLRDKAAQLSLTGQVEFLPPDEDIPSALRKCSLFLLPSKAEGFGIVLIEAQAVGLSCYASDTVPRETNVGGVSYLPLSDGPEAWAEVILREGRFQEKKPYDCSAFSSETFVNHIRALYGAKNATA